MKGLPLGPGGEDITWPDQVALRGRKVSSTRIIKPQTSNLNPHPHEPRPPVPPHCPRRLLSLRCWRLA